MSKKQTFIEINGRRYHAETGHSAGNTIARQTAKHAGRHQPDTSRTLMRQAVKKPAAKGKDKDKQIKAQGRLDSLAGQFLGQIEHRAFILQLDEERLSRARRIKRSQAISRFPRIPANRRSATLIPVKPVEKAAAKPPPLAEPQTTAELLERAVQRANSHEQPPIKLKRHGILRRHTGRRVSLHA